MWPGPPILYLKYIICHMQYICLIQGNTTILSDSTRFQYQVIESEEAATIRKEVP
jgi:hypothetical protein